MTTTTNTTTNIEHYAGSTRFEIELEFVQMLANPMYLNFLADRKFFDNANFIAYLAYLQYFREPTYLKYLQYPGPTLRALELLQEDRFRKDIINPMLAEAMMREGFEAATKGLTK
ncbi:Hypothetical protein R9X50_00129700 [Acrodontium crateriforme]|uniref:Mediator of RNA polymerase II transcription subunit 31 n=1 Tax=Acrodontium crateriforme TaxID=150365 RepID=A0AAQ3M033_9PEZI|nr:Hypothetical protein R9X50_00129700 [Acrodontium crateriforme]